MNSKNETKNDIAWSHLFKEYNIVDRIQNDGQYIINSRMINKFREARLMTKFDHYKNLPVLFKEHNFSILPISRGDYIIAEFDAYKKFDTKNNTPIEYLTIPDYIQSINSENITSEATAINSAYVSGILAHFLEEEELLPTVSGRMSSRSFNFNINRLKNNSSINLSIENSQLEIDGGYEGFKNLSLIEAKNSISSDFLIRQLYYPFRLWKEKIQKEIKPIFLIYSNGIFNLYEYKFEDFLNYNSLVLIKQKRFSLENKDIEFREIEQLLNDTKSIQEPKIPFPQADSFERVINLCELLYDNEELTRDNITSTYDFDKRQTNYYTDAGRYIGLIDKKNENGVKYFLTQEGINLFKMSYKQKQLKFVELILQHSAFSKTLVLYIQKAKAPKKYEIVEIMKKANLNDVKKDSTYFRRSSSIIGWLNWILELVN